MTRRKRILIFADYYLPSVGAGGGVRILANIVERFSDRYEFFVVARDHDSKTHREPFTHIPLNEWTRHGEAQTYYFSRNRLTSSVTDSILEHAKPDLVFLNSLFSIASVRFLWERRKGKYAGLPVIVSPCGEVLVEGLKRKSLKKRSYLFFANSAGLHRNIVWRATSEHERDEILKVIGRDLNIFVVPDLPALDTDWPDAGKKPEKRPNVLSAAFVARIVPNKNLLYLLEALNSNFTGELNLNIIGPHEDQEYWAKCLTAIKKLPSNVKVTATGLLQHHEVTEHLHNTHFFISPTKTENFGYAILEAFGQGCPTIISDRTHWNDLAGCEFAWILDLDDIEGWRAAIRECLSMGNDDFRRISKAAQQFARQWVAGSDVESQLEEMFEYALSQR